jgi:regulatory protein
MAIITRLVQGKKNPNRVNLYLDDTFAFALSIDEVARHNLKKGLELTAAQIDNLRETDESEYVYAKILNFLSFRPRTIKEVRERLKKYEVSDPTKQQLLIDRLKSKGYLDDLAFAKWFIESRNAHRPRSVRMLSQELLSKGVSREDLVVVTREMGDESIALKQLLTKKLHSPHVLEIAERQKISAYLARLGFSWGLVKEVVKNWESE